MSAHDLLILENVLIVAFLAIRWISPFKCQHGKCNYRTWNPYSMMDHLVDKHHHRRG